MYAIQIFSYNRKHHLNQKQSLKSICSFYCIIQRIFTVYLSLNKFLKHRHTLLAKYVSVLHVPYYVYRKMPGLV